tara:strand:+ start:2162 stop:3508 length:1347 start_codon:yes stop_codon:yes gene_type:complete
MNNETTIEFVNHASVLVSSGNTGILSDPWYSGEVFHKGWRLIYENDKDYIYQILDRTSYIFISHEHPDHFSPRFFVDPIIKKKIIEKKITFLFQRTKDKRVVNFLKQNGFIVEECAPEKKIVIRDGVEIEIVKHDFYDSSISIKTSDMKILNLNDCPLRDVSDIKKFRKNFGSFDVLLTQFSYAAWKGGKSQKIVREKTAREKLESICKQAKILNCKTVIPFASFVYFSNQMNFYMNDSVNTPHKVEKYLTENNINTVILMPGEKQVLKDLKQNKNSLEFWKSKYEFEKKNKKIDVYDVSRSLENLKNDFDLYQKRIFRKNSKILIYFLNKIKIFNILQDINIFLTDHGRNYKYSILTGLKETNDQNYHILMHSKSLSFLFKNEFGFDTLTVNGCFECESKNFSKISKILAIGSLNALGLKLNLNILFNLNVIILFLKKLIVFLRKLK